MKRTILSKDDSGREAFAYLAVLLLVLSTGFVTYELYLRRTEELEARDIAVMAGLLADLDQVEADIRFILAGCGREELLKCEVEMEKGLISGTLDGALEGRLRGMARERIEKYLAVHTRSAPRHWIGIGNISIDCTPLILGLEGAAPSPAAEKEKTIGLDRTVRKTHSIGVNVSYNIGVSISERGERNMINKSFEFSQILHSLKPLIIGRMDRLEMGLEGTELPGIFSYMVGTLAQMKCSMGYGRFGAGSTGPVITNEELLACADLALALMAGSHLGAIDEDFNANISRSLSEAPGSGGATVGVSEVFEFADEKLDPSMALIAGEGLFSGGNPPSLEMMARPLLMSIVDGVLVRMISYLGLDDELYALVGGLTELYELGVDAVNALSRTFLGRDIINSNDRSAREILLESLYGTGLYGEEEAPTIMNRRMPWISWEGDTIDGYPEITIPNMTRTFELYLWDGDPSNEFYLSPDGRKHSREEYFDRSEELLGWNSTIHRLSVEFSFEKIEPPFFQSSLDDPGVFSGLASYLGTYSDDRVSAEELMMEKGRIAIRKAVDSSISLLLEPGNSFWQSSWKGWTRDSMPDLEGGRIPLSQMTELQTDPFGELVEFLSENILRELDMEGFLDYLSDMESSLELGVAGFLSANFDLYANRSGQMEASMDHMEKLLIGNISFNLINHSITQEGIIIKDYCFPTENPQTLEILAEHPELMGIVGLGIDSHIETDPGLLKYFTDGLDSAYREAYERELGDGSGGREAGFIYKALTGSVTRGPSLPGGLLSIDLDIGGLTDSIKDLIGDALGRIEKEFYRGCNISGGRVLWTVPDTSNSIAAGPEGVERMDLFLGISRSAVSNAKLVPIEGVYHTDPFHNGSPYSSKFRIELNALYKVDYGAGLNSSLLFFNHTRSMEAVLSVDILLGSQWPLSGIEYENKGSIVDLIKDAALEAGGILMEKVQTLGERVLGDTMTSLREVPPLISDLVSGKELDLAEVSRVISNVTMDAAATVRTSVQDIFREIVDLGLSGFLDMICSLLDVKEIDASIDLGGISLDIHTEREALTGGEGILLRAVINIPSIGMHGYLSFSRDRNSTTDFNGTLTFNIGPLGMTVELDPFMTGSSHMISIGGKYDLPGSEPIRFSLQAPALDEYRSCEISLGETLGVEPFIPIPILGINAVIDAGFRMKYVLPSEVSPRINEIEVRGGRLVRLEIFNPRQVPLHASRIDVETREGVIINSWRLEAEPGEISLIELSDEMMIYFDDDPGFQGSIIVLLRGPSGLIWDDVCIGEVENGWYSRDADGYGVWRWGGGTPGERNSGSHPGDIRTLLISIAISSIKEAWSITYGEYGLSFDMVVPFLQRALELFMERFLSVVRELVIEVMMFLDVLITDSSGTAGSGLELFFSADGEAVADFFDWLYGNLKVLVMKLTDPTGAGNFQGFPMDILYRCRIGLMVFSEVELPISLGSFSPPGVELPDSVRIAVSGSFTLSFPMMLLGMKTGGFSLSLGVYIMDAPNEMVSLFYDVISAGLASDLWMLRIDIWQ
ncbi:MAG: hypothetical protein ACMUIE_09305 [Thermoplasmatota archaeon]